MLIRTKSLQYGRRSKVAVFHRFSSLSRAAPVERRAKKSHTKKDSLSSLPTSSLRTKVGRFHQHAVSPAWWAVPANQKQFLEWVRTELKLNESFDQLYQLTEQRLLKLGGGHLLQHYKNYIEAITTLYPEHKWHVWKFQLVPRGWWSSLTNQREYIDWVRAEILHNNDLEALYELSANTLKKNYGATLVAVYKSSMPRMLMSIYPEHEWQPWRFIRLRLTWWQDRNNQHMFMNWLRKKLNLNTLDDMYNLSHREFCDNGGAPLLSLYDNSVLSTLEALYPHHEWVPWNFKKVSRNWWQDKANQRLYIKWLARRLGLWPPNDLSALYSLTADDFRENQGTGLICSYKGSPYLLLKSLFSDHKWLPWKFLRASKQFWTNINYQRQFIEWLREELGLTTLEDCYKIGYNIISNHGGRTLLSLYKGSPATLFCTLYPNHEWHEWKFLTVPSQFWKNRKNVRRFLDHLGQSLGYETLDDMYSLSWQAIESAGGSALLQLHNSLQDLLTYAYPEHKWRPVPSTMQQLLHESIARLLPSYHWEPIARVIRFPRELELDTYSSELKVAAEYQGIQHYFDHLLYGIRDYTLSNDIDKALYCATRGIVLLEVPYWWVGSKLQLRQSLKSLGLNHLLEQTGQTQRRENVSENTDNGT